MNKDHDKLSALYQLQATEQPTKELDKKILALAKAQLPTKKSRFMPYSVAASMAIAGLLFLSFPEYYQLNKPDIAPDYDPQPPSKILRGQPESLASPQAPVPQLTPEPAPQAAATQPMADQTIAIEQSINPLDLALKKQRTTAKTSIAITEIPLDKRRKIDDLLAANKKQQAIKMLRQLQQQYPHLVMPLKYQQLLAHASAQH